MSDLEQVSAAGGVVYRQVQSDELQVLLIFRRGVWDLPKGKVEETETVEECAVREVAEEIGISQLPEIAFSLSNTYHDYEEKGIKYGKTTHWFGMQLTAAPQNGFSPETEEGIEKVKWVPLAEAKTIVGYDNLVNVLNSFEESYHQRLS